MTAIKAIYRSTSEEAAIIGMFSPLGNFRGIQGLFRYVVQLTQRPGAPVIVTEMRDAYIVGPPLEVQEPWGHGKMLFGDMFRDKNEPEFKHDPKFDLMFIYETCALDGQAVYVGHYAKYNIYTAYYSEDIEKDEENA